MAENKKSFLVYCDWIYTIKKLITKDREENTNNAGELFYHLLQYVNDQDPEPVNMIIDISFEPIKQQLKRDLRKYEEICKKNSENAHKRWDKNNATASDRIPPDAKHADIDNDSDNGRDKEKIFKTPGV